MSERTQSIPQSRARRDSRPPTVKVSTVLGVGMFLITLAGMVWGAAVLIESKADKATVNQIKIDVEVIKTRQEQFIRAVRPGLELKK